MRIEKTETVELLDWEKENGLEIVVVESWNSNKEKGFEYKSYVKSYINGCGNIAFGFGDSINDSLISLCKRISGEQIGHEDFYIKRYTCTKQAFPPNYKIINCPLLVHTKLVEPEIKHNKPPSLSRQEIINQFKYRRGGVGKD